MQSMTSASPANAQILLVGRGKLATEIGSRLPALLGVTLTPWEERRQTFSIVIHCGSGRQMAQIDAFCRETGSPLLQLATERGSAEETAYPVVDCPNANILMLRFMTMIASCAHLFRGYTIRLTESHQASKETRPGTAVRLAESLGLAPEQIHSVRDADIQQRAIGIPAKAVGRHAYHRIEIEDTSCSLALESRVDAPEPYANGVAMIVRAPCTRRVENRRYSAEELVHLGWI